MIPLLLASHLSMFFRLHLFPLISLVTCIGVTRGNGEIQFRGVEGRGDAHVILVLGYGHTRALRALRKCLQDLQLHGISPLIYGNIYIYMYIYIWVIYIYMGYIYIYV